MMIFDIIHFAIRYLVVSTLVGIVLLVIARVVINSMDPNPFSRIPMTIRRLSDPLISPVRGILMSYGLDPKLAPFVTILVAILIGWFLLELVGSVVFTLSGIMTSLQRGALASLIGYVLYGALGVYSLLIVIRIIFSWGMSYGNRLMRFLIRVTEPVLMPFRRIIPPVGRFDISPIVVLLILQLFQAAIAGTLIR